MKLTRKQLRQIIQESILAEAPKKINVGDKVKAFWKEGDKKKPYPATVTKINNTTYTVEWDSGDGSDEVPKGDVVVIQKDPSLRSTALDPATQMLGVLAAMQVLVPFPLSRAGADRKAIQVLTTEAALILGGESAAALIAGIGTGVALFAAVAGAFAFLPAMIQHQIDQLDTVEGFLKNFRAKLGRPIKPKDIANQRGLSYPKFAKVSWTRNNIIDYLAASSASSEGKALYGVLIAGEFRGNDGLRKNGPIISEEFAIAIQRRRKSMGKEGVQNMHKKIMSKAKELVKTPEGFEKVFKYTSALTGVSKTPAGVAEKKKLDALSDQREEKGGFAEYLAAAGPKTMAQRKLSGL